MSDLKQYIDYGTHVGLDQFGIEWIKNTLGAVAKKQELQTEEVEHIIDFLASDAAPKRISKMSYDQAKTSAEKWMKTQIKKGGAIKELPTDTEVVLDFKDGFKIVKLIGENAYKREGFLMSHCVASYFGNGKEIYSLRDADNMSHATMEKDQQIKGKGNGDIHPRYVNYVVKFLEHIGMRVGDSEMSHLGYINVEEFKEDISADLFNGKYYPRGHKLIAKDGEEFADFGLWNKSPIVEFTSNVEFRINFDLKNFIIRATLKLFDFLKEKFKNKETEQLSDNGKLSARIGSSGDSARIGSSGGSAQIGSSGDYARIGSSGDYAQIGSSGDYAQIGSSGDSARIGSSGDYAQIGSSGDYAQIGSSGDSARIGSSGDSAQIGSSGGSAQIGSSGDYAQIGSSGDYARIGSSGDYARIGSSGGSARIGSSGGSAQIGSSGDYAQIGSSGGSAQIGSSGDSARIGSSGDYAQIELNGRDSVGMAAGNNSTIKGKLGCWITLSEWVFDGNRYIPLCVKSAQIDGKILKEDTFYKLINGEFVEA